MTRGQLDTTEGVGASVTTEPPAQTVLRPAGDLPTWHTYADDVRRVGHYLRRGELGTALNRSRSMLNNLWNFEVRRDSKRALCPCCGWEGSAFISRSNWRAVQHNSSCPRCASRSRHRGLTLLLPGLLRGRPNGNALIFAPEASLIDLIRREAMGQVATTDFLRTDVDYPGEDIQQLTFEDNRFAFLLCNHVLEHIPDDSRALRECARVLTPGGAAVFTIPGDYDQEATRYFRQPDSNGHLRHYGRDVVDKMRAAFDRVEAIDMSVGADPRWHIHRGDLAFVCRK